MSDLAKWFDRMLLKWGVTLVALMVVVAVLGYGCGQRHRGALEDRAKQQRETVTRQAQEVKQAKAERAKVETVYVARKAGWEDAKTATFQVLAPEDVSPVRALVAAGDAAIAAADVRIASADTVAWLEGQRADSTLALAETYRKLGRGPLVSFYGEALHDLSGGTTLGGGLILGRRFAVTARGEADLNGGPVRAYVGLHVAF